MAWGGVAAQSGGVTGGPAQQTWSGRLPCPEWGTIFAHMISQPEPKADVLARRDAIVAGLRALLPAEAVIAEPLRLKPYETDGLSAYRQPPLAVVLPDTTEQVAAVMRFCHRQGVRVVPRGAGTSLSGRRPADGGCGGRRADADEPHPRHRLRRSLRHGAGRRYQYRHHQRGSGQGVLLRARPVQPARLHDRRQRQHEFGRRALPEIRRHRQQPARPEDRHGRRRDPRRSAASISTPPATTGSACSPAARASWR